MRAKAAAPGFVSHLRGSWAVTPLAQIALRIVGLLVLLVALYHLVGWWGVAAGWGWKVQGR